MKRRRNRPAPKAPLEFEWPVPDVRNIGDHSRGAISNRDKAAINMILQPEIDQEKLWTLLLPVIEETRSPKEIVKALESAIYALEISAQIVISRNDSATAQAVQKHATELREHLRYYAQLMRRRQSGPRLKKIRILRAWLVAGGEPTIVTPDDPDRLEGARRGRGKPSGPLIKYLQTAFRIICNETRSPHGVKWFFYKNYRKHFHLQYIGSAFSGSGRFPA